MKKILLIPVLLLLLSVPSSAQTLTLIVQWDPNPTADAVVTYQVTLSGGTNQSAQSIPATSCTATVCQATFTAVGQGNYTATVIANNEWGVSPAGTGSITITFPGQVKNIKGRKG